VEGKSIRISGIAPAAARIVMYKLIERGKTLTDGAAVQKQKVD
jgi:hypothetical protein